MSQFEDFVVQELPQRPVMLMAERCGGYTGDPNDPGAPTIVQNSPKGTFYLRGSDNVLWKKHTASAGSWGEMSSGGGGGGVTPYATEALLLAATPAAGSMGYAQDMGDFWFRRAATWQKVPSFAVASRALGLPSPLTAPLIRMDASLGDDSEWNDGSVTPLKTLDALFKRLSAVVRGLPISVHFAAGDYPIASTIYADLPAYVYFIGAAPTSLATFTVDSYSGDNCHVHKPVGDPAWTVDEWAGYWIELPGSSPTNPARYPIMGNGTHDLIVGIRGPTSWNYAPVGTTAKIFKFATKITGTGSIGLTSGTLALRNLLFDRAPSSGGSYFFLTNGAGISAFASHFKCANSGGRVLTATSGGNYTQLRDVLVENGFSPFYVENGVLQLYGITGLNTSRLYDGRQSLVHNWENMNFRNGGELFFPAYRSCCVDRGGRGQLRNCPQLWAAVNRGNYVLLLSGMIMLDGQAPGNLVDLGPGGRAHLSGTFAAASTIGVTGLAGSVSFSVADLETLYGNEYDYGQDTVVAKI